MVPNSNHSAVNVENPQIPSVMKITLDEPPPQSSSAPPMSSVNKKCYDKMPSWREISKSSEPDFCVAILIDDIHIKDRHVSALSKPASRCYLTNIVVLHSSENDEKEVQVSVDKWLKLNRVDVDVEDIVITHGKNGYEQMLTDKEVDAVYVLVSPE
jgi:dihydrofolate reductase